MKRKKNLFLLVYIDSNSQLLRFQSRRWAFHCLCSKSNIMMLTFYNLNSIRKQWIYRWCSAMKIPSLKTSVACPHICHHSILNTDIVIPLLSPLVRLFYSRNTRDLSPTWLKKNHEAAINFRVKSCDEKYSHQCFSGIIESLLRIYWKKDKDSFSFFKMTQKHNTKKKTLRKSAKLRNIRWK